MDKDKDVSEGRFLSGKKNRPKHRDRKTKEVKISKITRITKTGDTTTNYLAEYTD